MQGYEVTLYADAGRRGRKRVLTAGSSCLQGFNDIVSSVVVRKLPAPKASATLYEHCGYRGYAVPIGEGYHSLTDLVNRGMKNDDISSVRVGPGSEVILYEDFREKGSFRVVSQDTSCLSGFNDVISSADVRDRTNPAQAFDFGVTNQCVSNIFGTGIVAQVSWYHPSEVTYDAARREFSSTKGPRKDETILLGQESCFSSNTRMVAVVRVKDDQLATGIVSAAIGTVVSAAGAAVCLIPAVATAGAAAPAACPGAAVAVGAVVGAISIALPGAEDVFYLGAPRDLEVYGTVYVPKYEEQNPW